MTLALNEMKTKKVPGPSDASLELIVAHEEEGLMLSNVSDVRVLNGLGMKVE